MIPVITPLWHLNFIEQAFKICRQYIKWIYFFQMGGESPNSWDPSGADWHCFVLIKLFVQESMDVCILFRFSLFIIWLQLTIIYIIDQYDFILFYFFLTKLSKTCQKIVKNPSHDLLIKHHMHTVWWVLHNDIPGFKLGLKEIIIDEACDQFINSLFSLQIRKMHSTVSKSRRGHLSIDYFALLTVQNPNVRLSYCHYWSMCWL